MVDDSQGSDPVEPLRVRDLLRSQDLSIPSVVGEDLCGRLGSRAWQRPNVAISGRLYRKYGVEDPWDPNSENKGRELGLGPVGLRLTEPRRQVAPHLKPKEPKKKKKIQAADPLAKWRKKPSPSPRPDASATQQKEPVPKSTPLTARENPSGQGVRGQLPVRPDLADVAMAKGGPKRKPRRSVESTPRSDSAMSPSPPSSQKSRRGGARVRMKGRHVQSPAPQVIGGASDHRPPARAEESSVAESNPEAPRSPSRSIPKAGLGMDDLFGAAAEAGRLRFRSKRSKSTEEGGE